MGAECSRSKVDSVCLYIGEVVGKKVGEMIGEMVDG